MLAQVPREGLESPSLETIKTHLDAFLSHLLLVTLPGWAG